MPAFKSLLLCAVFALGCALPIQAATLANFSITEGDWIVEDDNTLTISGEFAANITGAMFPGPEDFGPTPVVYSAFVRSGADRELVYTDRLGPIMIDLGSPNAIGALISGLRLGWGETAFAYMVSDADHSAPYESVDFNLVDLVFPTALVRVVLQRWAAASLLPLLTPIPEREAQLWLTSSTVVSWICGDWAF